MEHVRGIEVIVRKFTRDELVDMRIEYKRRMKEAERKLLSAD